MLDILYRDAHLVAIQKPSGLLVHRSNIDRHETRFAVQLLRDQIGTQVFPTHRLDRGTSGVLLFALDKETLIATNKLFETNAINKTYLAVVRGHPSLTGIIAHPLQRIVDEYDFKDIKPDAPAQLAVTHYERLATVELPVQVDRYPTSRYALVKISPETGRRHQIRRHFKHISHPIIGDATYGKGRHNRLFQDLFSCRRMLLACTQLDFKHPFSGEDLMIRAPLCEDFASVLTKIGWEHY